MFTRLADAIDSRKQVLPLSVKTYDALHLFKKYWKTFIQTMKKTLAGKTRILHSFEQYRTKI